MNYEGEVNATLISIPEQLLQIIGVVYSHHRTSDGGDIYLTQFGMPFSRLLEIDNWYEKLWFEEHREKLEGTSAVYRVRTKELDGSSLDIVVNNSRFGEDVPLDTRTLMEFINAEFNSPWEIVHGFRAAGKQIRPRSLEHQNPVPDGHVCAP